MSRQLKAPWVKCIKHGIVRGYATCKHVWKDKKEIVVKLAPQEGQLGLFLCDAKRHLGQDVKDAVITCEECAIEKGIIKERGNSLVREDIIL